MGTRCCSCNDNRDGKADYVQVVITKTGETGTGEATGVAKCGDLEEDAAPAEMLKLETKPVKRPQFPGRRCPSLGQKQIEGISKAASAQQKKVLQARPLDDLNDPGATAESTKEELKSKSPAQFAQKRLVHCARAETALELNEAKGDNVDVAPVHFRRENKSIVDAKYEVIGDIGKGAFGEVKRVREKTTGHLRAMKIFSKLNCSTPTTFSDEIKILQKLVTPALTS
jgi:hypothetical protein